MLVPKVAVTTEVENGIEYLQGWVGGSAYPVVRLFDAAEDEEDLYGDGASWWVVVRETLYRFREQDEALRFFSFALGESLAEWFREEALGLDPTLPREPLTWHNGHAPTLFPIPTTY